MRAPKNVRYLRLLFILFIEILLYLKVLKKKYSSMKLNLFQFNQVLKTKLFHFMRYKLEFTFI